jgi:hypothetical protein
MLRKKNEFKVVRINIIINSHYSIVKKHTKVLLFLDNFVSSPSKLGATKKKDQSLKNPTSLPNPPSLPPRILLAFLADPIG